MGMSGLYITQGAFAGTTDIRKYAAHGVARLPIFTAWFLVDKRWCGDRFSVDGVVAQTAAMFKFIDVIANQVLVYDCTPGQE